MPHCTVRQRSLRPGDSRKSPSPITHRGTGCAAAGSPASTVELRKPLARGGDTDRTRRTGQHCVRPSLCSEVLLSAVIVDQTVGTADPFFF
eukprot:751342-Hanusia_phi.AAC.1